MAPIEVPAIISNSGRLGSPFFTSNFGKSSASALKVNSYAPNAPPPCKISNLRLSGTSLPAITSLISYTSY